MLDGWTGSWPTRDVETLARRIRGSIADHGYVTGTADSLGLRGYADEALVQLQGAYESLALDGYLPAGHTYRLRRHGHLRYDPSVNQIAVAPPGTYLQPMRVNRLTPNTPRRFEPIDSGTLVNPLLGFLIGLGISTFTHGTDRMWDVNAHLVRIRVVRGQSGMPTPEGIHRDGFDYISLHLINRRHVVGGRSVLCDNDYGVLSTPLMADPLDSIFADDRRVLHGVEPIALDPMAESSLSGYRDMLLISYHPDGKV